MYIWGWWIILSQRQKSKSESSKVLKNKRIAELLCIRLFLNVRFCFFFFLIYSFSVLWILVRTALPLNCVNTNTPFHLQVDTHAHASALKEVQVWGVLFIFSTTKARLQTSKLALWKEGFSFFVLPDPSGCWAALPLPTLVNISLGTLAKSVKVMDAILEDSNSCDWASEVENHRIYLNTFVTCKWYWCAAIIRICFPSESLVLK